MPLPHVAGRGGKALLEGTVEPREIVKATPFKVLPAQP